MDMPEKNTVREMPQTFNATPTETAIKPGLAPRYRAKVFKSGNSLALRLPKALGLEAGMEMDLTLALDGAYSLKRIEPAKQKLDISGFWGKAKGLHVPERRDFDERPSTIAARLAKGDA